MIREDMALVAELRKFLEIADHPGFEVFQKTIRDVMDESNIFASAGGIREGWSLGEEFAFRLGQKDAALTILSLPDKMLTKARELVQKEQDAPGLEETPQEAFV